MQTKQLFKMESSGSYGAFEVEIAVGATKLPDLNGELIRAAADDAARLVQGAIMAEIIRLDPASQARAAEQKRQLLALFPGEPYVEEVPNGYCSRFCCKHLPWFVVTTMVGRIKIGWRKSVIQIDWSETHLTKNCHELFRDEDVTKSERSIHAWSYEDAQRYITTILNSAVPAHGVPSPT